MIPLDCRLVRFVWEHDPGVVKYHVQVLLFERNSLAVALIVERSLRFSWRNWTEPRPDLTAWFADGLEASMDFMAALPLVDERDVIYTLPLR
jgi:hypothetical protein